MSSEALVLTAGEASLTLYPQLGGMINALVIPAPAGPRNVIAGVDPAELPANPGYRGAVLFPFPNRMRDGRYHFAGRDYQFAVNEAATGTALHGFLFRVPARVVDETRSAESHTATLEYQCDNADEGYPFSARVALTYILSADGALAVSMTVKNTDNRPIPVGVGWHPYYTLGRPVDECVLHMPPARRVLIDERMLPTGETVTETRFLEPAALGETTFDDCFVVAPGRSQVSFWSPRDSFGVTLWQQADEASMHFTQLYIPPDRQSLAVEPMSCGIDAFNTGAGLVTLEPGQDYRASFGVQPITAIEK